MGSEKLPKCFGDGALYDPKCKECAGGYDPSCTDNPGHIREKCGVFEACGAQCRAKTAAAKLASYPSVQQQSPVFSGSSVSRQIPVQMSPQYQRSSFVSYQNPQVHTPIASSAQMMPVNYGMPSYLTVLEPKRMKKNKKWKSLSCEVGRSIGKSIGHSIAFFFDSVPWESEEE